MKTKNSFGRIVVTLICSLTATMILPGCVNIPREVQESVKNVRGSVADLHGVHAQDVRAFASCVNERERALKEADMALRQAFQARLEAQITASKVQVMGEYDRRVSDLLGVEMLAKLQDKLYPQFDKLEHTQQNKLIEAFRVEAGHTNDPMVRGTVRAALQDLYNTRSIRERLVSQVYLARAAALSRSRYSFESAVDEQYAALEPFVTAIVASPNTNSDKGLADFNKRVDAQLVTLDGTYNSLDQALSDVSTFLDSEAMSRRFATHFFKGVSISMVDDLKDGQVGAAALSELLCKSEPEFVKKLKQIEDRMKEKADNVAESAANSIAIPSVDQPDAKPFDASQPLSSLK